MSATIKQAYRDYLLMEGKQPASVFKFCKDNSMAEAEFYDHFGSFEALEKSIWQGYIENTRQKLEADEAYAQFTSREKILTFYFSLAEMSLGCPLGTYTDANADSTHRLGQTES